MELFGRVVGSFYRRFKKLKSSMSSNGFFKNFNLFQALKL